MSRCWVKLGAISCSFALIWVLQLLLRCVCLSGLPGAPVKLERTGQGQWSGPSPCWSFHVNGWRWANGFHQAFGFALHNSILVWLFPFSLDLSVLGHLVLTSCWWYSWLTREPECYVVLDLVCRGWYSAHASSLCCCFLAFCFGLIERSRHSSWLLRQSNALVQSLLLSMCYPARHLFDWNCVARNEFY